MLVASDALTVAVLPKVPDLTPLTAEIKLGGTGVSALEEAVYANPLLLQPFDRCEILYRSDDFMLVPAGCDGAGISKVLGAGVETQEVFYSEIDHANSIAALIDTPTRNFFRRTFDTAGFLHPLAKSATFFASKSRMGNSGKLFVLIDSDRLDVVGFGAPGLVVATSFPSDDNATYYVLACMKTAGLDPAADEILIAGAPALRTALMDRLRDYAASVMPMIIPSVMAGGSSASSLPFELII